MRGDAWCVFLRVAAQPTVLAAAGVEVKEADKLLLGRRADGVETFSLTPIRINYALPRPLF
jgi:hypothetical protein